MARTPAPRQAGFTLMELVVVMIVLAILAAGIGTRLAAGTSGTIKEEARRLALVMQTAQEQAVLESNLYALHINSSGYFFMKLNTSGKLERITDDDLFQSRDFPDSIHFESILVDEQELDPANSSLLFPPDSNIPMIAITLKEHGTRWLIESHADGNVVNQKIDA